MGQRNYIATLEVGAYKTTLAVQIQQADGHWDSTLYYDSIRTQGVDNKGQIYNGRVLEDCIKAIRREVSEQVGFDVNEVYIAYAPGTLTCSSFTGRKVCEYRRANDLVTSISEDDFALMPLKVNEAPLEPYHRLVDSEPVRYLADKDEIEGEVVGTYAQEFQCVFNLFSANTESLRRLENAVRLAGLAPQGVCLGIRGAARMLLTQRELREGVALVNAGHLRTEVAIYRRGVLQHYFVIPVGMNLALVELCKKLEPSVRDIEEQVQREADITPAVAQHEVESDAEGEPLARDVAVKQINEVVKETLTLIFACLYESLYMLGQERQLASTAGVVFTGGATCIRGFEIYLKQLFADYERKLEVLRRSRLVDQTKLQRELSGADPLPAISVRVGSFIGQNPYTGLNLKEVEFPNRFTNVFGLLGVAVDRGVLFQAEVPESESAPASKPDDTIGAEGESEESKNNLLTTFLVPKRLAGRVQGWFNRFLNPPDDTSF